MNKTRVKFILKYLASIITGAIFVILVCCALTLGYYFVSMRVSMSKGANSAPPFSIYTIVSPSMTPLIQVYDVIVNVKVDSPTDIKVGDIITFKSTSPISAGMTVTHRVQDIQIVNGQYEYTTKGDANAIADMSTAKYSNVIGIAKVKIPQLGRLQLFVASKFGWLVVVVIPALVVIIKDIMKLVRIAKVKKDAQKANLLLHASDNGIDNPDLNIYDKQKEINNERK